MILVTFYLGDPFRWSVNVLHPLATFVSTAALNGWVSLVLFVPLKKAPPLSLESTKNLIAPFASPPDGGLPWIDCSYLVIPPVSRQESEQRSQDVT